MTKDKPPITLAITHYCRYKMLLECVEHVLEDPRIGEIIVSDDRSRDTSFGDLLHHFQWYSKVRLYQNDKNLDCYVNKRMAVKRSSFEWVILFDCDNIIKPDYLDALYDLPVWDRDVIYCPEFAEPHFNYTAFSGMVVDSGNVSKLMDRPHFSTALNTANYFFNRENFLSVWDGSVDPHTADSIFMAYNWLNSGRKLMIVPGLRYFHRVHEGSHYKNNVHKTGDFARQIEAKLKKLS